MWKLQLSRRCVCRLLLLLLCSTLLRTCCYRTYLAPFIFLTRDNFVWKDLNRVSLGFRTKPWHLPNRSRHTSEEIHSLSANAWFRNGVRSILLMANCDCDRCMHAWWWWVEVRLSICDNSQLSPQRHRKKAKKSSFTKEVYKNHISRRFFICFPP